MPVQVRRTSELAMAITAAPSPMALLDTGLTHLAASPLWQALHGATVVGRPYDALFPDLADGWAEARAAALDGETATAEPVALVTEDGATRWVRYTARPWRVEGEADVQGLVVHALDVTDEVSLREHVGRQRSLVEAVARHAPMILFAFDREGTVTLRAGKGLDALGLSPSEWSAESLLDESPVVAEGVRAVLAGEPAAWFTETRGRAYEVSAAPSFRADGRPDGGVGIAVDVTERVRAEREAAQQADGLRRVVTAISRPGDLTTLSASLLAELTAFLGLGGGLLAQITYEGERGTYTVLASHAEDGPGLPPGTSMPLGDTYCDLTMEAGEVVAISHMGTSEFVGHRCYAVVGLEAYIGAPVVVDGEVYGALSFSSTRPAERPFTDADRNLVRMAAQWAGGLIERDLLRQQRLGAR